jgi:hypothetical protein
MSALLLITEYFEPGVVKSYWRGFTLEDNAHSSYGSLKTF